MVYVRRGERRRPLSSLTLLGYVLRAPPSFPLNLRRDLSPLITSLIARGYCKAQWHSWGRRPARTAVSIFPLLPPSVVLLAVCIRCTRTYMCARAHSHALYAERANPCELLAAANYEVRLITTYVENRKFSERDSVYMYVREKDRKRKGREREREKTLEGGLSPVNTPDFETPANYSK